MARTAKQVTCQLVIHGSNKLQSTYHRLVLLSSMNLLLICLHHRLDCFKVQNALVVENERRRQ